MWLCIGCLSRAHQVFPSYCLLMLVHLPLSVHDNHMSFYYQSYFPFSSLLHLLTIMEHANWPQKKSRSVLHVYLKWFLPTKNISFIFMIELNLKYKLHIILWLLIKKILYYDCLNVYCMHSSFTYCFPIPHTLSSIFISISIWHTLSYFIISSLWHSLLWLIIRVVKLENKLDLSHMF